MEHSKFLPILPAPDYLIQVADVIKAAQAAQIEADAANEALQAVKERTEGEVQSARQKADAEVQAAQAKADEKRLAVQSLHEEAERRLANLFSNRIVPTPQVSAVDIPLVMPPESPIPQASAVEIVSVMRPENQSVEKVLHVLMIHSSDRIIDGGPANTGSKVRIRKGAQLVDDDLIPKNSWMVWTQGFQEKNPTESAKPWDEKYVSVGANLVTYCKSENNKNEKLFPQFEGMQILQEAMGWEIMDDVENACKLVLRNLKEKRIDKGTRIQFHFVTHPIYMKRVEMVWNKVAPREWKLLFHPTEAEVLSKFEIRVMERLKQVGYRLMLLRRKRIRI